MDRYPLEVVQPELLPIGSGDRLFTLEEAAQHMGIKKERLADWIKAKKFPSAVMRDVVQKITYERTLRLPHVREQDVADYLDKHGKRQRPADRNAA